MENRTAGLHYRGRAHAPKALSPWRVVPFPRSSATSAGWLPGRRPNTSPTSSYSTALPRRATKHPSPPPCRAPRAARHVPWLRAVAGRALHAHQAAEDVFQATFLVLARKAASIRKRASIASWLYGVAYRVAVRAKTQAATRRLHEHAQVPRP